MKTMRRRKMTAAAGAAAAVFLVSGAAGAAPAGKPVVRDLAHFLRRLTDFDWLPLLDSREVCKQFTTWNRGGTNGDGTNYYNEKTGKYESFGRSPTLPIVNLKGPGCVTRIFCAGAGGIIRFYLDGKPEPVIELPTAEMFAGKRFPFLCPIVYGRSNPGGRGLGHYSYFPVPFAKSCRIVVKKDAAHAWRFAQQVHTGGCYYAVSYSLFPEDEKVVTYSGALSDKEKALLDEAVTVWSGWKSGRDPRPQPPRDFEVVKGAGPLGPGRTTALAELSGAGWITSFKINVKLKDHRNLRLLRLRAFWDGEKTPAIDAPLGDFFGYGHWDPGRTFTTLLLGKTREGYYCYFPMPFADGARIEVENGSGEEVEELSWEIAYRKLGRLPANAARFRACWHQELVRNNRPPGGVNLSANNNITIVDARGEGRYVGCNLHVVNRPFGWWGEGDVMFFIDEDTWPPSFHGTGTEDYFNSAWCGFGNSPVNAAPILSPRGYGRGMHVISQFHISDPIPFRKRARITLEHWGHGAWLEQADPEAKFTLYGATGYWYQLGHRPPAPFPVYEKEEVLAKPMPSLSEIEALLTGSEDPLVRRNAMRALIFFGYTDSAAAKAALTDDDMIIRGMALELAEMYRLPAATEVLVKAFDSGHPLLQGHAANMARHRKKDREALTAKMLLCFPECPHYVQSSILYAFRAYKGQVMGGEIARRLSLALLEVDTGHKAGRWLVNNVVTTIAESGGEAAVPFLLEVWPKLPGKKRALAENAIVNALKKLTKQDFGKDFKKWKDWHVMSSREAPDANR